mmetsp:Transcript_55147/g.124691  ORF Transcript_55147/g.124691 Transcript_55147/m.124691 type:complete len:519 (-) Transcript_55147:69-1625(-)
MLRRATAAGFRLGNGRGPRGLPPLHKPGAIDWGPTSADPKEFLRCACRVYVLTPCSDRASSSASSYLNHISQPPPRPLDPVFDTPMLDAVDPATSWTSPPPNNVILEATSPAPGSPGDQPLELTLTGSRLARPGEGPAEPEDTAYATWGTAPQIDEGPADAKSATTGSLATAWRPRAPKVLRASPPKPVVALRPEELDRLRVVPQRIEVPGRGSWSAPLQQQSASASAATATALPQVASIHLVAGNATAGDENGEAEGGDMLSTQSSLMSPPKSDGNGDALAAEPSLTLQEAQDAAKSAVARLVLCSLTSIMGAEAALASMGGEFFAGLESPGVSKMSLDSGSHFMDDYLPAEESAVTSEEVVAAAVREDRTRSGASSKAKPVSPIPVDFLQMLEAKGIRPPRRPPPPASPRRPPRRRDCGDSAGEGTTAGQRLPVTLWDAGVQVEEPRAIAPERPWEQDRTALASRGRTVVLKRCEPDYLDLSRWRPQRAVTPHATAEVRYKMQLRECFPGHMSMAN